MQTTFAKDTPQSVKADVLVCFATEFDKIADRDILALDNATNGAVKKILATGEFSGKEGELTTFYRPDGYEVGRVVLAGLGKADTVDADSFRRATGRLSRYRSLTSEPKAAVWFGARNKPEFFQAAMEGYLLGGYQMLEYKTGEEAKDRRRLKELMFISDGKSELGRMEKAVARGTIIADGQMLARNLAGTPSNDLTPSIYADRARELAAQYHFGCRVLDEEAIRRERMGAFLAVTKGSAEPPRFIVLTYKGGPAIQKPIVLVGKGITFDSGGISLKPGQNMHEMKQDMAGSAAVLAAIVTAARLKLNRNIVGLIPACENMPSGTATRPGDIVKSRKGKTIEIINTDAEGRLILSDALDYANKFDPQAVIDIATLTGAALYILGYSGAPVLGNNETLLNRIREASAATAERVWPLPIWDDHREQMKSDIADLVNSGGKPAGTIAASAFLENFIGDWPWAHIDIAYVDLEPKGKAYVPKGPTGFGLRLLVELLSNWRKL